MAHVAPALVPGLRRRRHAHRHGGLGLVVLQRVVRVLDASQRGAGHGVQEVAHGARSISATPFEALRHVGHGPSEQRAQALERLHGAATQDAALGIQRVADLRRRRLAQARERRGQIRVRRADLDDQVRVA